MKSEASDPKNNPYLAHHYEEPVKEAEYNGYANGYRRPQIRQISGSAGALPKMPRHSTTAALAKKAENGPYNPFNGQSLSSQYFNLLETRRNLPVHAQR